MNEEYIDNVKHLIEQKDADQVKELLAAYVISACCLCFINLGSFCEY